MLDASRNLLMQQSQVRGCGRLIVKEGELPDPADTQRLSMRNAGYLLASLLREERLLRLFNPNTGRDHKVHSPDRFLIQTWTCRIRLRNIFFWSFATPVDVDDAGIWPSISDHKGGRIDQKVKKHPGSAKSDRQKHPLDKWQIGQDHRLNSSGFQEPLETKHVIFVEV